MTRQQAKELLPIIAAFAEGKEIQVKNPDEWVTTKDFSPYLNDYEYEYRIKPEPREFWILVSTVAPNAFIREVYDSKERAIQRKSFFEPTYKTEIVHVREIISD